jgi:ribonuclease BN (tRNA processing enzyme)
VADGANLDLTVLGAGPAYTARPGALGASYLVRHGDDAIVLDLGQGVFANLAGAIEPSTLRAIAISHLHPDHFVDLVPLRHYLKWDFEPPRRVDVLAPAGLADRLDALHAEPGFTAAALDVTDLDGDGTRQVGPFTLEARRVEHTEEGYGFRVTAGDGPGLVYSGDCGDIDDLRPLVRAGDALLCEVSFGLDPVAEGSEHLNAYDVGRLAAAAGSGRVLLTHILMGHDRQKVEDVVRELAGVPVDLVDPGDRFAI